MRIAPCLIAMIITSTLLSGCFDAENPCHYFTLEETNLKTHSWNIDTMHLYVLDTATNYFIDTTFTNCGAARFNPNYIGQCHDTGALILILNSGQTLNLDYGFGGYGFGGSGYNINTMYVHSTTSLDGYPGPFAQDMYLDMDAAKTRLQVYYNVQGYHGYHPYVYPIREWDFVLSKK